MPTQKCRYHLLLPGIHVANNYGLQTGSAGLVSIQKRVDLRCLGLILQPTLAV